MPSSKTVLKPCVGGAWKHIGETAKLLDVSQSLELSGINKAPDLLRELDKIMYVVIDLSGFV